MQDMDTNMYMYSRLSVIKIHKEVYQSTSHIEVYKRNAKQYIRYLWFQINYNLRYIDIGLWVRNEPVVDLRKLKFKTIGWSRFIVVYDRRKMSGKTQRYVDFSHNVHVYVPVVNFYCVPNLLLAILKVRKHNCPVSLTFVEWHTYEKM